MSQEPNEGQEPTEGTEAATLIVSKGSGLPFKTHKSAEMAMLNQGFDPEHHEVVTVQGGFAIQTKGVRQAIKPGNLPSLKPGKPGEEKYLRGVFVDRTSQNETERVVIAVNGEVMDCGRGVEVCLPERFWKAATCTRRPRFRQMPGMDRQDVGTVTTYPFSITGEGTEEQWKLMKALGTKKTRQDAQEAAKL